VNDRERGAQFQNYVCWRQGVEIRVDRDRRDIVLFETMIQRRLALLMTWRRGVVARVQLATQETLGVRKHQQNRQQCENSRQRASSAITVACVRYNEFSTASLS
jgi:hypothetical protein